MNENDKYESFKYQQEHNEHYLAIFLLGFITLCGIALLFIAAK